MLGSWPFRYRSEKNAQKRLNKLHFPALVDCGMNRDILNRAGQNRAVAIYIVGDIIHDKSDCSVETIFFLQYAMHSTFYNKPTQAFQTVSIP